MNQTIVKYALYAVIAGLTISLLSEWNRFSRDFDDKRASELRQQQSGFNATDPGGLTSAGSANSEAAVASNNAAANSASNNQASFNDSPFEDSTTPAAALIAEPAGADAIVAKPAGGASAGTIQVDTDTLRVLIDKAGGDIIEVALKQHLSSLDNDAEPLRLLEKNGLRVYTAQSGLIAKQSGAVRAVFNSEQQQYTMQAGQPLDVVLRYTDENGIELNKIYRFEPGLHTINVSYQIKNNSQQSWQASFYAQISRDNSKDPGTENAGFGMQSYLGAATTTEESPYQKIPFKDIEKNDFRNAHTNGWIAMIQHYFVSAWVPPRDVEYQYFTKRANNGLNIIGMYSHPVIVPPGGSETTGALFYAGPKNQYRLAEIAEHLDLTIDYGWLWMLAQPLYALLYFFATGELHVFGKVFDVFGGFNNWGFAIIMLTVVVKLLFFRLSASSYRSMANMRRVQPKLLAIRDRYKTDKQAQSKAMMELYQKEKINPLGGCLPILIQMPVFIALYWALMESVELRHAPFALWIKDLSVMDPYFILPLLMGATMFFQQKMNPAPPDPMQAKVMQWMPVIFTFFFLWFPAGLVIYWVSNNVLSIAQQWVITRQIEHAAANSN